MKSNEVDYRRAKGISKEIEDMVCEYFKVENKKIHSRDKTKMVYLSRSFIIYLLHREKMLSVSFLCEEFGRSRRTIFAMCEQVGRYIRLYEDYRQYYIDFCDLLKII